tara:strand:- start:23542 stop:26757 length:3216 start_codon:yes stop_codon:yes gene_type:complete
MKLRELLEEEVSRKDINDLEKFADRILKKYGVDIEFTKHFVDRMNDPRNSPEIKVSELQRFFKKIQKNKARNIINNPDIQAVLKDMSTNLNLPVVIKTKGNEIEVTNKTIMRKPDFKTPNKVIKYESFRTFSEATESVVFTFGRFNPPTTGHEKLIEKVKKIAGGDDYYIFPSHSQNNKKDPLPLAKKVAYMRDMFPKHKRNIIANNKLKTVLDIAVYFHQQGYVELNMVVGSDRVAEFKKLLTTYNGQEKRHGFYDFDTIQIFSAGERDPDAEGVTGMSASKMRAAATNNDYDTFQKGLPRGFKNGNQLFKDVRKGMNLKENSKYSDEEIERDLYVRGAIYQIGDLVENINDGTSGEIIRRGTNYVQYTDGENVHKAFLHSIKETKKITKTKQDSDIKDSPGSEPAKYYAKGVGDKKGMSVSTKKARDAHFTKGAKMDDDNPNAYKPAPGDKDKKTKPSQYTKKFKQMYGEVSEKRIDPADIDDFATDDDIKAADKNIMMQLRKSVSLRGNFPVQFMDKKKVKVSSKIAQAVQSKYDSMKKASDKEKFQSKISKSYKDLLSALKEQLNINEQPKHEITVGDYTTKFFYMCGSAQTTMKKHADKEGAEELTRMQDLFYKMEKDAMDSGGASDEQKKKSQILYDKIIAKADDIGIKNEVDKYMKLHLTSMLNNKPKLGFGRTDISESLWKNIHKKRQRIKQGSGEKMRKPGEKGAPTPAQLKRAKGEETDIKEMPYYRKIYDKIHQMVHPKGYDRILKMYIQMHKQGHRNPAQALGQMVKGVNARDVAYYINGLVKKGKLPSDLAAKVDFEIDESVNLNEKIEGLVKKSQQTGVPYGILKKSYDRGLAAWKTGHRPGTTPQQWAFARVNSMLTGGKADPDLQKQARASKKKKKKESYEIGEPYARHTFDVTPGQDYEQSVKSKVASESNIQDWFERPSTRKEYQERYKDEWEEKLQETYNLMRSKISKDDLEDKYIEKLEIVESEYQGRKVKLNDPFRLPSGSNKKFGVYVKNEKGNVVKVTFGDPNMEIKRDDPGRLKSFRARHNCDNPGPKTKARYWSCFQWRKGAKVDN